jgi:hypothetical protein
VPDPAPGAKPGSSSTAAWVIILLQLLNPTPLGSPEKDYFPPKCNDPDCQKLLAQGFTYVVKIQERVSEMLRDPRNLYTEAYSTPNPSVTGTNTTWMGHQQAIRELQDALSKVIKKLQARNCPVPPGWLRTATTPPPDRPQSVYRY